MPRPTYPLTMWCLRTRIWLPLFMLVLRFLRYVAWDKERSNDIRSQLGMRKLGRNLYVLHPAVCHSKQYIRIRQHNNPGKVITKVIYISVNNYMFRHLLGHYKVYLCVLRCWIFVQYRSIFFSSYSTMWLFDYCLIVNLCFVYSSALNHIDIKLNYIKLKLVEN
jgi:hypothetical protein